MHALRRPVAQALALGALLARCAPAPVATDAGTPTDTAMPPADATDVLAATDVSHATDALDAPDASATDALDATDARDASVLVPPCFGASQPLVVSHHLPFATVGVGAGASPPSGLFLIDLATTASAIDLRAFGSHAPAATGCDPARLGQSCTFADLAFFGSWGSVVLTTEDLSGLGGVSEAGILGTDFTSTMVLTLDYAAGLVWRATRAGACTEAQFAAAGFAPVPTDGFYASDTSTLRPLADVQTGASSGVSVPNVPTVTIRLAGVAAVAQLDTGFDDALVPSSVNINPALFDAIVAAHAGALVRDAAHDLALSTCVVGVSESVEAYDLAPGFALELVAVDGTAARSFATAAVFVKRTPASARTCGGIGTWTAPAGQIAASLLASLGTVVFDPFAHRVRVRAR